MTMGKELIPPNFTFSFILTAQNYPILFFLHFANNLFCIQISRSPELFLCDAFFSMCDFFSYKKSEQNSTNYVRRFMTSVWFSARTFFWFDTILYIYTRIFLKLAWYYFTLTILSCLIVMKYNITISISLFPLYQLEYIHKANPLLVSILCVLVFVLFFLQWWSLRLSA